MATGVGVIGRGLAESVAVAFAQTDGSAVVDMVWHRDPATMAALCPRVGRSSDRDQLRMRLKHSLAGYDISRVSVNCWEFGRVQRDGASLGEMSTSSMGMPDHEILTIHPPGATNTSG